MLYAIEWIRQQLLAAYQFIVDFFEVITLASIGDFLTQSPPLLVLCLLAGLALVLFGFRCHKLISSIAGSAAMGYIGWHIAAAINPSYISSYILLTLLFAAVGLFVFYMLYVITVSVSTFIVGLALMRWLFGVDLLVASVVAALITIAYCILLLGRPAIRTSITGGVVFALVCFHFFGILPALGILAVSVTGGTILQLHLIKDYKKKLEEARNFRPNAPSPPSAAEIAAELAEEAAERSRLESRVGITHMVTEK